MIIFFGPAGSGKSIQGQILAARHNWRWLSAGQMLRDLRNPNLLKEMSTGELVDEHQVNTVIADALARAKDLDHVILDGFPRQLSQAQWLVEHAPQHGRSISLIIVLEVPKEELMRRMHVRGRLDDTPQAIQERLDIYHHEVGPIVDYFVSQHVPVAHVDGMGTVGEVYDRIESELQACSLV